MRVLHLFPGNLYGGVERLLVTLARHRDRAPQMEPEYGLCYCGRLWDELTAAGVPVHDLGTVRVSRPWTVWRARRRLRTVVRDRGVDVVVCHANWPHAVFAPAARVAGVRVATWAHDALTRVTWIDRWAARTHPDVLIANSRFTAGTLARVFPRVPAEVVYLPVEPHASGDRTATRAELSTPADAVVILQASRLERWKGPAVWVEALGRLRDVPGWVGWLAGGPQKGDEDAFLTSLKVRANELGIADRVRFLGQRSDVARLMTAADVYCQPNTGPEPFGVVLVEALAAGLPVVTSGVGGAVEVVDESCGVLTPPGDADAVAEALRKLVADPARRRQLGSAGPARAAALCDPGRQLAQVARVLGGKSC